MVAAVVLLLLLLAMVAVAVVVAAHHLDIRRFELGVVLGLAHKHTTHPACGLLPLELHELPRLQAGTFLLLRRRARPWRGLAGSVDLG